MDNSERLRTISKRIENVSTMIKALLSKDSAFLHSKEYINLLAYLSYLAYELGRGLRFDASSTNIEWITVNGNRIPIDKKTKKPIGGQQKALGNNQSLSDVVYEAIAQPKTSFQRDDTKNEIYITEKMVVKDEGFADCAIILPQTAKNITSFCGKKNKKGVVFRDEKWYVGRYGGHVGEWSHCKAWMRVIDCNGKETTADVHWFECDGVGQVGWKVKGY